MVTMRNRCSLYDGILTKLICVYQRSVNRTCSRFNARAYWTSPANFDGLPNTSSRVRGARNSNGRKLLTSLYRNGSRTGRTRFPDGSFHCLASRIAMGREETKEAAAAGSEVNAGINLALTDHRNSGRSPPFATLNSAPFPAL